MEENQRLSDRTINTNQPFGPDDQAWNQFIRDHKDYIKKRSTLTRYKPEELLQYRYRPAEFHVSNEGHLSATWIFMLINNISSPMEFNESRTQWWVMPRDLISELYSQHISVTRNA